MGLKDIEAARQQMEQMATENARLRAALLKFVDHFGPLEDNHMLHETARECFKLARASLGPEAHDAAIRLVFAEPTYEALTDRTG